MFVLDTNVLSELMKSRSDMSVARWASQQPTELIFTTSISKAEMLAGIAMMPLGRRRTAFGRDVDRIFSLFHGRVLAFDENAAAAFAEIVPARRAAGRPIGRADLFVASIARAHGAAVVTRDVGGFEKTGVPILNPWEPS